jgi:sulfide dehydrogenase cytochrome subunit
MLVFSGASVYAADISKLTKDCADCHGKNGNSKINESPSIAGMSSVYFKETMEGYTKKTRPAKKLKDKKKTMLDVVKKLSDAEKVALADHYAKQKFIPYKQDFDAGKAKAGKKLHKKYCGKCHTKGATSAEDDAGILAGQPSGYLKYSIGNYASGKRDMGKKMAKKFKKMMKKEGDEGIDKLVHYYASKQ